MAVQGPDGEVAYLELHGSLEYFGPRPSGRDLVVLSNIQRAEESSAGVPGLAIRYVERGCENYRIGGRGYRLESGHVLIAAHDQGADCEVRRVDRSGTLGVCTLISGAADAFEWARTPLLLGANCTALGPLLQKSAAALSRAPGGKLDIAQQLMRQLRAEVPRVAETVLSQAAAVDGAKSSTRFEMVRRAHLAQAYLHATTDRAVDLAEVSVAAGVSQFRLLAAFQHCFGETPASYHRKLRLNLALEEARNRRVPIGTVCDEFGFASASSFSHAYRRAFGRAPVWTRGGAA